MYTGLWVIRRPRSDWLTPPVATPVKMKGAVAAARGQGSECKANAVRTPTTINTEGLRSPARDAPQVKQSSLVIMSSHTSLIVYDNMEDVVGEEWGCGGGWT